MLTETQNTLPLVEIMSTHIYIYKHIYIAVGELVAQLYNLGANHMACLLITQAREN